MIFLFLFSLEKYLKLSSDTSPLEVGGGGVHVPNESSSSPNEYDSSAFTSPDNLSPPAVGYENTYGSASATASFAAATAAAAAAIDAAYQHQYQQKRQQQRRQEQQQQPQSPTKKYSFGSNEDALAPKPSTYTSFARSESSTSYRPSVNLNQRPIGSQHTSLLLERYEFFF